MKKKPNTSFVENKWDPLVRPERGRNGPTNPAVQLLNLSLVEGMDSQGNVEVTGKIETANKVLFKAQLWNVRKDFTVDLRKEATVSMLNKKRNVTHLSQNRWVNYKLPIPPPCVKKA